jgi:hypothetical protein
MKNLLPLLAIVSLLFAGCKTAPTFGPAIAQEAVTIGVQVGLVKYPEAAPILRAAAPVVCAVASGTNIQPAQVISVLQGSGVINATNVQAVLILNSAIGIYTAVFDSFGANWTANQPVLQSYLKAVCDGINAALPPASPTARSRKVPPHLP